MSITGPRFDLGIPAWSGVAAPLVYLVAVVAGGASIAGYDHIRDPISSLTEAGRVGTGWIQLIFLLYNLLVLAFAARAFAAFRRDCLWAIAFALLALTAACGLLMWPFAQDPIGAPATPSGIVHLALAAIESVSSVAIVGLSLRAFRVRGQHGMMWFAAACLAVIVTFGLAAAAATDGHWPTMGVFERLTIGGFEVWIATIAVALTTGRLAGRRPAT